MSLSIREEAKSELFKTYNLSYLPETLFIKIDNNETNIYFSSQLSRFYKVATQDKESLKKLLRSCTFTAKNVHIYLNLNRYKVLNLPSNFLENVDHFTRDNRSSKEHTERITLDEGWFTVQDETHRIHVWIEILNEKYYHHLVCGVLDLIRKSIGARIAFSEYIPIQTIKPAKSILSKIAIDKTKHYKIH